MSENQLLEHLAAGEPGRRRVVEKADDVGHYLESLSGESPLADEILCVLRRGEVSPSRRGSLMEAGEILGIAPSAMREYVLCLPEGPG